MLCEHKVFARALPHVQQQLRAHTPRRQLRQRVARNDKVVRARLRGAKGREWERSIKGGRRKGEKGSIVSRYPVTYLDADGDIVAIANGRLFRQSCAGKEEGEGGRRRRSSI